MFTLGDTVCFREAKRGACRELIIEKKGKLIFSNAHNRLRANSKRDARSAGALTSEYLYPLFGITTSKVFAKEDEDSHHS